MALFREHNKQESQKRLEADGIDAIIKYEYNNHECDYTGDIAPLAFLIEEYGTTWEYICEVLKVDKRYAPK